MNGTKMSWYSVCSFLLFCLGPMVRNDENISMRNNSMRTTAVTVMIIFLKAHFWEVLHNSYVQPSLSAIKRHIDYSILKNAQQSKILWIWINMHSSPFIQTGVNIMRQKSMNLHGKLSVVKKSQLELRRAVIQNSCP